MTRPAAPRTASAVTLPPESVTPTRRPAHVDAAGQQRGERARAARLGDGLQRARTAAASRRRSRRRRPATTSSTRSWMTGKVSSPGIGSCWPSAIVRGTVDPHALAGGERAQRCRRPPRARRRRRGCPGASAFARGRAAGDQAAAADADQQHVERAGRPRAARARDRALPGHHALVVVRVDRDEPALGDELGQQRLAVGRVAVEARSPRRRSRAVAASLPARRVVGHQDRRPARRAAARPARAPGRGCPRRRSRRRAARSSRVEATRPRCRRRGT